MAQQDLAVQGQEKRPSEFADACAAIRDVPHRGRCGWRPVESWALVVADCRIPMAVTAGRYRAR
jgi:hypothetical protein